MPSFLKSDKPKSADFVRFLQLLLQGMSLHAAEGAADDVDRFRSEIAAVSKRLTEQSSSEDILVALGAVIHALEELNRRASLFVRAQAKELHAMFTMTASTVAFLVSPGNAGVDQLQAIERSIDKAIDTEDLRKIRLKLAECLTVIQNDSVRRREDAQSRIALATQDADRSDASPAAPVLDPATGLQLRADAEQLIASRIVEGKDALVVLFLVDRLSSLNARFGRKVGDEVLLTVARHLGQQLPEKCPPFRWSGPAFLAVLGLSGGSQSTERLVRQIAAARLEKNIEALGRSVLLPVSCSVVVLKIGAGDSAELVFHTLDKHVASHSGDPN